MFLPATPHSSTPYHHSSTPYHCLGGGVLQNRKQRCFHLPPPTLLPPYNHSSTPDHCLGGGVLQNKKQRCFHLPPPTLLPPTTTLLHPTIVLVAVFYRIGSSDVFTCHYPLFYTLSQVFYTLPLSWWRCCTE